MGHVGALDRHAREQRTDLIRRDVVEGGRIAALEIVGQDREQRRRQPFDLDVESLREVAAGLVHSPTLGMIGMFAHGIVPGGHSPFVPGAEMAEG